MPRKKPAIPAKGSSDNKHSRYALSLLEVVVALVIAGFFFSSLLQFFIQSSKANIKIQKMEEAVLPIQLMQLKLSHLLGNLAQLPQLTSPEGKKRPAHTAFFTSYNPLKLSFSAIADLDPDPNFNGVLTYELFCSQNKQLVLLTHGQKSCIRREVLLENVILLSFSFFATQDNPSWHDQWEAEGRAPLMMKMQWKQAPNSNPEQEIVFFLSQIDEPIPCGTAT